MAMPSGVWPDGLVQLELLRADLTASWDGQRLHGAERQRARAVDQQLFVE